MDLLGSFKNLIRVTKSEIINNSVYLGKINMYESELDTIATTKNVPNHKPYMLTVVPKTVEDGVYLSEGGGATL